MKDTSVSVLLYGGAARQVLPMAKALRKLGCEVTTYNASKLDPGYVSRYPNRRILGYFNPLEPQLSYNALSEELKRNHYDLLIPLHDEAAIFLSQYKKDIESLSKIAVNDWSTIQYSIDKLKTMEVCMKESLPCPQTYLNKEEFLNGRTSEVRYPVVIKPRTGCAAVGFHVSETEGDAIAYLEKAERKYGPCLIQEYIPQDDLQYKCEMYIDRHGNLKGACVFAKVRWYPIDGGSSCLNETVDRPDIIADCEKLLKSIGWRGYADIDLIQDPRDGKAKIMEINPRITGSVKICFAAGVDFARMIVEDLAQQEVCPQFNVKYHTYMRYMHTDLLWFLKSPERFRCKPSWFNFKNTVDQIFSWDDPLVWLAYTLQGFNKILKDRAKRTV